MNYDSYLENEEVCVDDIAKLLEVSRKSATTYLERRMASTTSQNC
jgi:Mn-dependent DtxR family transcriptional regulator